MFRSKFSLLALTAALACSFGNASSARADVQDRLYDFTDAYYFANGVNPANIVGRRQPTPPLATTDVPNFNFQRNVRALLTLPAFDHSGNLNYFTVLGGGNTSLFTNDAVGRQARQIADASPEYVFPKKSAGPISLSTRQSVILDMRNGYFSNNRLGLWIHVFVSYTPKALTTRDGQRYLADLARRNGTDFDGTPIIKSVGEINDLVQRGYATKVSPAETDTLRYAICPVIKDPTDGGIAPDQFLAYDRRADGTPVQPRFLSNFLSLQQTGDWAD